MAEPLCWGSTGQGPAPRSALGLTTVFPPLTTQPPACTLGGFVMGRQLGHWATPEGSEALQVGFGSSQGGGESAR